MAWLDRGGDAPDVFDGRAPRMVRLQLADLVEAHGDALLDDARLVRAMLSDAVASARREINLINAALSIGVAERLRAAGRDPIRVQSEIENLTLQLVGEQALHPNAAAWAVRSCAWALHLAQAPDDVARLGTPTATTGHGASSEDATASAAPAVPPVVDRQDDTSTSERNGTVRPAAAWWRSRAAVAGAVLFVAVAGIAYAVGVTGTSLD